ncbi:3-demethylubiquinone-9 3-methyltransferase [Legionella massiliensis]|uniref:3-demethylubiquinone-9 3-methyltransferase n=1 Tax=Legionella massiliensis TaxID=1034943 RepID=A0A078L309_9GAMM|nr:class I SAM-dependent methyltransferase [Legionella massiliensis]CDZ78489.1 3-demethylubiquinone-9 3-methyltransferase [Legionella massiliensis]CEE14227.1 Ubiquinone biosynthesis O-methyltransferase [Legionella massiliensis]
MTEIQNRLPFGKKGVSLVDRFGVYLSYKAIQKFLLKDNQSLLLDIGCGYNATLLSAFQHRIKQGVGIDYEVNPALKANRNLAFVESSLEEGINQFNENTFDVIMLISVLEHLPEPEWILKRCFQLLKPNAVFLINVPTWRGKGFLEFSAFNLGLSPRSEMDDHKMYYDKRDLWPLLVKAGFIPSKIKLKYHKFGLNLFAVVRK